MKKQMLQFSKVPWKVLLSIVLMVAFFSSFSQNFPFPQNYQYPYGGIYKGSTVAPTLQTLYEKWKADYYEESGNYGRVKFIQTGETGTNTVSEGVAYGMLITVYMDNATNSTKAMFDKLWAYYKFNKNSNGFMNWKVVGFTGTVAPGGNNANGATDADVDVATALLLAHKQWGTGSTSTYLTDAQDMMNKIWMYEVNASKMLKPGDMFDDYKNPCYFITNGLELFKATDTNSAHDWGSVITNSYTYMAQVANATTGLMPDWANNNGTMINCVVNDKFESYFLYDAIRIPWRLAHAYAWYGHSQALTLGSKITDWAITKFGGNPAAAVDGYLLNGNTFNNPCNHAAFTTLGKFSNPCFTGGFGIGGMMKTTTGYTNFLQAAWTEGSKNDPYGHYYTETTQLLYMMCLTGNMPNFWNMLPEFVSAETNSTGNKILVTFSKNINASTIAASLASFSVKYGNGTLTATATAGTLLADGKTVELTLNKDITEPIITISYSGTALKGTENDGAKTFTDKPVTDKILNGKPYAVNLFTNVTGTQVLVLMSKDINAATLTAGNFSVSINGTAQAVSAIARDATNPAIVTLTLTTPVSNNTAVITCTYTKGTMASTGGGLADSFTARVVSNYYMSVTCGDIENFDPAKLAWAKWASDATWNSGATTAGNATKVGAFMEGTTQANSNLKAIGITDYSATMKANPIFKVKVKVSAACDVRFRFFNNAQAPDWNDAYQILQTFTITAAQANTWVNLEADLTSKVAGITYVMDGMNIELSPGTAGGQTIYFDDIQFCPPAPVVKFVSGRTNYTGDKIEVKFNTPLAKPSDLSGFSLLVGGTARTITAVDYKQGDQTYLVFTVSPRITNATSAITMSYSGTSVKSMDNRNLEPYTSQKIINMYGVVSTMGWRNDYAKSTDQNEMSTVAASLVQTEILTGVAGATDGAAWNVVATGVAGGTDASFQNSMGPVVVAKVWDLTANPIVKFKYKVTSTAPLYIRVDLKDYANGRTTDGITEVLMISDNAWHEYTFNFNGKFYNQYGNVGDVDKTNIVQALFYLWKEPSSAANTYKPATFAGTVQFDYILVGADIALSNVTASVNEGTAIAATSNVTGKIYLVPATTPQVLDAILDSITAQKGVSISNTANVAASIPTTGIKPGNYMAYAFDANTGGVSSGVPVEVLDITKPLILTADAGNYPLNTYINASMNEAGYIYVVPQGTAATNTAIQAAKLAYRYTAANTNVSFLLSTTVFTVGQKLIFYAIDNAGNISAATTATVNVLAEVVPDPIITAYPSDSVSTQTASFNVTVDQNTTVYVVPNGTSLSDRTAIIAASKVNVAAVKNVSAAISTTALTQGIYYIIAVNSNNQLSTAIKLTMYTPNPIITGYPADSVALNQVFDVTVDQNATVYVVPLGTSLASVASITAVDVLNKVVTKGVAGTLAAGTLHKGGYLIVAVNANNQISASVPLKIRDVTVSINNVADVKMTISPVPMKEVLHISAYQMEKVEIMNTTGQLIETINCKGVNELEVNTSAYSSGVYYIKVYTQQAIKTMKACK